MWEGEGGKGNSHMFAHFLFFFTLLAEPVLMMFLSKTLSSAGSSSSPTSSTKRGLPKERLSSKWFLKYL